MLQDIDDDDDRSSLSSLTELSHDSRDGEILQAVTDGKLVSQAAAALKDSPKRALRKRTRTPHPKTTLLRPIIRKRKWLESQLGKRFVINVNHDLEYWVHNAPVYRLAGVSLKELQDRGKNGPKDKARAQEVMEEMETWESDGASGIFQDELGNTLIAYFGRRVEANVETRGSSKGYTRYIPGPHTPSAMGRSSECLDNAERAGSRVYFDGIKKQMLDKVLVSTQLLVHHIGVQHAICDGRHDRGDFLMKYAKASIPPGETLAETDDRGSFVWEGAEYVYEDGGFASESTGVIHLVHGWPEQGRDPEKHGIHPSKDMVSGPRGAPHVYAYFQVTEALALRLAAMFRVAFPEFYEKYRKAFEAGKWTVVDPGPFLGRVIVWKLSVLPHQDGLDEGPAVIFPMGRFEGGECYLPDLKLKLSYQPGEVIMLMGGALYHGIGDWTPEPGVSEDGVTSGRVSNVWFFPHSSYELLKDKPAGWSLARAGGTINLDSYMS
ncbi:hypothetical protein F4604DRAFT_1929031 [Suillus subluteus]|nr:hypothetical protein F4604DRAFT_1929031 [Suillus subluteus]